MRIGKSSEISAVTRASLSDTLLEQSHQYFANVPFEADSLFVSGYYLRAFPTKQSASFPPSGRIIGGCSSASSFLRALATNDYSKKASSDYAHLIGWDSHGNCEVN